MAKTISVIGSFRKEKNYNVVREIILFFKNNGLAVLSPAGSDIVDSIDDFVIFQTDDDNMNPVEIQMVTLDKIVKSDIVYVCDCEGYVGKTTCYEIGFCYAREKPIYFLEKPKDLPMPVPNNHVVSKEELVQIALQNIEKSIYYESNDINVLRAINGLWSNKEIDSKTSNNDKVLLVCGSMQFYDEMLKCQEKLKSIGVSCIIPKDETAIPEQIEEEDYLAFKRKVSNSYLRKIRQRNTSAILVYNAEKRGVANYIGPNTLVELAMAFMWNRKIFIYNDYYEPFLDELKAWNAKPIHGDLSVIAEDFQTDNKKQNVYVQMSLNDIWGDE